MCVATAGRRQRCERAGVAELVTSNGLAYPHTDSDISYVVAARVRGWPDARRSQTQRARRHGQCQEMLLLEKNFRLRHDICQTEKYKQLTSSPPARCAVEFGASCPRGCRARRVRGNANPLAIFSNGRARCGERRVNTLHEPHESAPAESRPPSTSGLAPPLRTTEMIQTRQSFSALRAERAEGAAARAHPGSPSCSECRASRARWPLHERGPASRAVRSSA